MALTYLKIIEEESSGSLMNFSRTAFSKMLVFGEASTGGSRLLSDCVSPSFDVKSRGGAFFAHHLPREGAISRPGRPFSTPVRLHRHGNTTFALPLLSQNLLSGEGNSRGWTTIPRDGVGDWISIGIL